MAIHYIMEETAQLTGDFSDHNVVTMEMNTTLSGTLAHHGCDVSAHLKPEAARLCQIDYIGHGFIIVIIAAVGMVMNALNLVVLRSPRLPESCYVYLRGLALADLLSLFFFGTNSIGRGHYPSSYGWNVYDIYVYFPLCSVTAMASVILTMAVSVERYIYIYKPHQAKVWCQPRKARKVVLIIGAAAILINIPRFFIFKMGDDGTLSYTEFGMSMYYKIISWTYFVLVSLGGCIVLIVLNILLIRGIHKSNTRRRCLTGKKAHKAHQERRLTLTLISIICVFIIGELPSSFVSRLLLVPMAGTEILKTLGYKIAANIATALVVLQHSLNFVMYCVFNRNFWVVFKETLCGCFYKKIDKRSPVELENSHTGDSGQHNINMSQLRVYPVITTHMNGNSHTSNVLSVSDRSNCLSVSGENENSV